MWAAAHFSIKHIAPRQDRRQRGTQFRRIHRSKFFNPFCRAQILQAEHPDDLSVELGVDVCAGILVKMIVHLNGERWAKDAKTAHTDGSAEQGLGRVHHEQAAGWHE